MHQNDKILIKEHFINEKLAKLQKSGLGFGFKYLSWSRGFQQTLELQDLGSPDSHEGSAWQSTEQTAMNSCFDKRLSLEETTDNIAVFWCRCWRHPFNFSTDWSCVLCFSSQCLCQKDYKIPCGSLKSDSILDQSKIHNPCSKMSCIGSTHRQSHSHSSP